ncbi:MAG: L-rhamnose/proton symporter RhaT [Pirellulales bacterium]|nr:L-rhamnose/proton symporter RhaT [Pirellulales bacterium]
MEVNPMLGVLLHAIGGLAAASFYIPCKRVRGWSWETYWLVLGIVAWLIAPLTVASLMVPDLLAVFQSVPAKVIWTCYFYGVLWGIGGLMYGLTMRYLGISLGIAIALGFCAAFGTLAPPVLNNEFSDLLEKSSGIATLAGVAICLIGIAICGLAGIHKEKELSAAQKQDTVDEFSFVKGMLVAIVAGVMSACMAIALDKGAPLAEAAIAHGAKSLWSQSPVFLIAFAGGLTTNLLWCGFLNLRNGTLGDYVRNSEGGQLANYWWCALGGVTWYLQFMFYGMGTTRMGPHDFSSWTIHMAFIIVFGTLWGLALREWRGVRSATVLLVWVGIVVLVLSTIVVGWGNYLAAEEKESDLGYKSSRRSCPIVANERIASGNLA